MKYLSKCFTLYDNVMSKLLSSPLITYFFSKKQKRK